MRSYPILICVYRFEDQELSFIKETVYVGGPYNASISDFDHGFWVDENYEFTKMGDNKYWIPPSKILCIRKEWRSEL